MATFKQKKISSSTDLIKHHKAKPIIYVEGDTDKRVFENFWFVDLLEKISFSTVSEAKGCSAVVKKVGIDRLNGVRAFGLVDRDKLMADDNWALLRETDDHVFDAACPYPDIKITRRWELESYLIDPLVIENYVAVAEGGRPSRPIATVEADFLQHADALIPLAALNQALHLHRARSVGDGFSGVENRVRVDAKIRAEKIKNHPPLEPDYNSNLPIVDAFAGNPSSPVNSQLYGLLRILSGKGMLERVCKASKINHDLTYFLARDIKQADRVPLELKNFVNECLS